MAGNRKRAAATATADQRVAEDRAVYLVAPVADARVIGLRPKIGRPKGSGGKRSPAVEDEIVERLAQGEPMAAICRSADYLPDVNTVLDWCGNDAVFAGRVARAREVGGDALAVQALMIADEAPGRCEDGRIDPASVADKKLRFESRMKLLACWHPKRYGDRLTLAGDEDAPLHLAVARQVADIPADARARIARELAGSGADDAEVVQALPGPD